MNQTHVIRRVRAGKRFRYLDAEGRTLNGQAAARIDRLAIPPAWKNVRIASSEKTPIQATGKDARGRKQYIYSPHWTGKRERLKYTRIAAFGAALPDIRARVKADLRGQAPSRLRITAAAVRLMGHAPIRSGSKEYERTNGTFGLTTLRKQHLQISGERVSISFNAKGSKQIALQIEDRALANALRSARKLKGEGIFRYLGDDGAVHRVSGSDIARYLSEGSTQRFTSKDFRTWAASVLCAKELAGVAVPETVRARKAARKEAECVVAEFLGNTPAICRTSYIYPGVFEAWESGKLGKLWRKNATRWRKDKRRDPSERLLLALLKDAPKRRGMKN